LSWTDYYPFGGILPGRSGTSAIDHDNIKFTGYEKESEGGLDTYHAEARGYDPVIGRFTSRDPLYDEYPSWSPYTYTLNNPIIYTDPTGEFVFTAVGAVVGGVMAAIKGEDWKIGALSGAAAGAVVDIGIASGGTSLIATAIIGGTSAATGSFVHQGLTNKTVDPGRLLEDAAFGFLFAGLTHAGGSLASYAYSRAIIPRGSVSSGGESPLVKVLKGTANPKVLEAVNRGKKAHSEFSQRASKKGWDVNARGRDPQTGKTVIPDAVTPSGRPIELKPNTPTGRAKGARQISKYERAFNKSGRVIYYDPN
jgi:RHS repeat-associated protein